MGDGHSTQLCCCWLEHQPTLRPTWGITTLQTPPNRNLLHANEEEWERPATTEKASHGHKHRFYITTNIHIVLLCKRSEEWMSSPRKKPSELGVFIRLVAGMFWAICSDHINLLLPIPLTQNSSYFYCKHTHVGDWEAWSFKSPNSEVWP